MDATIREHLEKLVDAELGAAVPEPPVREVAAGAAARQAGDADDALCIVLDGQFKTIDTVDGETLDLGRLGPGAAFGAAAFLCETPTAKRRPGNGPARTGVVADEDSRVLVLDPDAYRDAWRGGHPGAAARLVLALARRLADRVNAANRIDIEWDAAEQDHDVVLRGEAPPVLGEPGPLPWLARSAHGATSVTDLPRQQQVEAMILALRALQPLGGDFVQRLGRYLDVRRYGDGQAIQRQGQKPDGLFLLLDGAVDVHLDDAPDRGALRTLAAGRLFGQLSFLLDQRRTASCTARGPATVGILGPAQVQPILDRAERGSRGAVALVEWLGHQVAEDWRAVQDRIRRAFRASRGTQGAGA